MSIRYFLGDESGQILRHVIKIVIAFIIVILLLVEIGPIILLRFTSNEETEELAADAAQQYFTNNLDEARARAAVAEKMKLMNYSDQEIRDSVIQFLPEGPVPKTVVRVTSVRYAKTLVSRHISWLRKYEKITKTEEAPIQQK